MRHTFLTALLTFGVVSGLAFGILGLRHRHYYRHAHFEERVARVCVDAAKDVLDRERP
jgi:hypothetical protein